MPPSPTPATTLSDQLSALLTSTKALAASAKTPSDLPQLKSQLSSARQLLAEGASHWVQHEQRVHTDNLHSTSLAVDIATNRITPRPRFRFRQRNQNPAPSTAPTPPSNHPTPPLANVLTIDAALLKLHTGNIAIPADELSGRDVTITGVASTTITLLGTTGALRITDVQDVVIVAGAVAGSVHVSRAEGCVFRLRSRQMRAHGCVRCDFWLDVRTGPVVERCSEVRFGEGEVRFEGWEEVVERAGLEKGGNLWESVSDFLWLRKEGESPNWERFGRKETVWVGGNGTVEIVI